VLDGAPVGLKEGARHAVVGLLSVLEQLQVNDALRRRKKK
jgi:hypothetical protein